MIDLENVMIFPLTFHSDAHYLSMHLNTFVLLVLRLSCFVRFSPLFVGVSVFVVAARHVPPVSV